MCTGAGRCRGSATPEARILLLGLAPAAHGGNRTGRVFTGDASGDFLWAGLYAAGLADRPASRRADDALLLPALAEQWQEFLGYLVSFLFIGGIWVSNAGMTKLMRHSDTLAYGIDLLMLLFVGVLPFSTNLMVTHLSGPDVEAAVIIYGLNVLLASLALSLLMFYIASERSLVLDGIADETLEAKVRQRWILIGLNVAGIALAVVAPLAAVGVYLAMTFLALLRPLVHLRRRRRQGDAAAMTGPV